MNMFWASFIVIYILVESLMAASPLLARKNVLFGVVFGSADIRKNPQAQKIIRRFVLSSVLFSVVIAAVYAVAAVFMSPDENGVVLIFTLALFTLIACNMIPYIAANRAMKAFKKTVADPNLSRDSITVEVGAKASRDGRPVRLEWFLILLVPLGLSAVLTAVYYPAVPDPIPVHFNAAGVADAWQAKSVGVVSFPVIMQAVIAAIVFFLGIFMRKAPPSVKGSPGATPGYSAFRRFLTYWSIGFSVIVQVTFMMIVLLYADIISSLDVWNAVFIGLLIASVVVLIIVFARMRRQGPKGPVYDDDAKWVGGMFYYNPSDPSIFVEKRMGIGQTLNFGHPAAWIFIAAIAGLVVFSLVTAFG